MTLFNLNSGLKSGPKQFYSRFLKAHEGKLHFAAHSHHFWPDVSRDAQIQYWDDCAKYADEKWNKIFTEVMPRARNHIARILKLTQPEQIVFAPNTHELTARVLSLFLGRSSLRILTTENEFHSWRRQFLRLSELPQVQVMQVACNELLSDRSAVRSRVIDTLKNHLRSGPDLFFLSQVFFDSGLAFTDQELCSLVEVAPQSTIIIIDGYHGFGAIPIDLSKLEGRIFYLGGGYKYAQAGEGVGFMVVPKGEWRPADTGWLAEYTKLSTVRNGVGYAENAMAFMGATQDPSGLYRFNAVWDQFQNLEIQEIHQYVRTLQVEFIRSIPAEFISRWKLTSIFSKDFSKNTNNHGHFLTFEAPSEAEATACEQALKKEKIQIDRRGCRIRFGFGLYQDLEDVAALTKAMQKISREENRQSNIADVFFESTFR